MKPRILDLFCGAGGAAVGYARAGFEVVGVDIAPQKHYPFEFHQADALEYCAAHGHEFDAIHASPPCQRYSIMRRGRWPTRKHASLIEPMRSLLRSLDVPYVIENVVGAPLETPFMLCGTMFGLQTDSGSQLRRHRIFEASFFMLTPECRHNDGSPIGVYGGGQHPGRRRPATIGIWGHAGLNRQRDQLVQFGTADRRRAMGIDWMSGAELSQAIPPAYTEYIGKQLLEALASRTP